MNSPPNSNLVDWRSVGALAAGAWLIGIVIYYAVLAGRYGEWPQLRNVSELVYVTGQTLATWAALAWFLAQLVSVMARRLPARAQIWFIPGSAALLSTLPVMIVTAGGFPAGFVLLPLALVAGMINPDSLFAFGHPLKLFLLHEAQLLLFCFMGIALFFSLGYSWRVAPRALRRGQRALQASIAVVLVLGAIFTAQPLTIAITDDQKMDLLVFQWIEEGAGFFIEPHSDVVLSDVERAMLKNLGLRGTLRMTNGRSPIGRGAPVTMMIVMHEPLTQPVRLPQPRGRNVVYLQRGGVFEMYPAQTPRLERVIELSADKYHPEITRAMIDMAMKGQVEIPVLTFMGGTSESMGTGSAHAGDTGDTVVTASTPWHEPTVDMALVAVPGGCYAMGTPDSTTAFSRLFGATAIATENERPVHEVCVGDFWLGKYEVTVAQYLRFVTATNSHFPAWLAPGGEDNLRTGKNDQYRKLEPAVEAPNNPIIGVSWRDAVAFTTWLSKTSGRTYRLPTEAEWEYACRSGGKQERYAGDSRHPYQDLGWHSYNSGGMPRRVGTKTHNGLGLYDMSGNVAEFTADTFRKDAYRYHTRDNPVDLSKEERRVIRGGSWLDGRSESLRCARRVEFISTLASSTDIGFRVLRVAQNAQNAK